MPSSHRTPVPGEERPLPRIGIAAGWFLIALSGVLVAGWMIGTPEIIWPGFFDAKFNTALLFTASGVGLLATRHHRQRILLATGSFVLLVAGLTLLEYVLGYDLGIDQLFLHDTLSPEVAHPGRMSPGTSIAFVCAAAWLICWRARSDPWGVYAMAMELLGFLVFALGSVGFIGHLYGIAHAYSWGTDAQMAFHTATGFIVLGGGLMAFTNQHTGAPAARVPLWLPALLCFAVLMLDLLTPRGVAAGIAYVPLVFCSLWFPRPRTAFIFALIATLLTIFAFLINPPSIVPTWMVVMDRVLTIGVLWFMAIVVYLRRRSESERLASEDRLEAVAKLLVSIVGSSTDAIISKDLNGVITSWNIAAEHLFGYTAEEVVGQPVTIIIPPERIKEEKNILAQIHAGEKLEHFETQRLTKYGKLVDVSLTVSPLRDGAGNVIGASKILRDIRERREAEKTRDQLRHVQKMESLGQLTGGIAHDFNNLLAVIIGNLDFMAERTSPEDPLREFITPCLEAAEHGAALTKQLLAFSRKQPLKPKIISINELLHHFLALARHTLGEQIESILKPEDDLWNVKVDPSQLQNALLNLAVNARDAMPDGGRLVIETQNVSLDTDYAAHNAEVEPGDYAMIAVSDSGEGMSADIIEKVFEPFFTTKEVGKGSGLGLSMVYGFVKQSAGHIKIYSEVGHGTSIKIYLPRAEGTLSSLTAPASAAAPRADKSKLILVVEDNKSVLKLTTAMAEDLGYSVLTAETGDAALDILRSRSDIALLLTDVMLPGTLNGPALARQAVMLHPQMKVLFNSGYAEHALMKSGMIEEGVHLLSKPFRKQQLANKLDEMLRQV